MLTRLVDWLNVPPGAKVAPKNPLEYRDKLRFHQRVKTAADYGLVAVSRRVTIWTDGACSGNPGPGGWGAVLRYGAHEKELKGGEPLTTNNRMELTAAIEALESLNRPCPVSLHTDSQYLRGGVTGWLDVWKRNGWRTADKKPVKNEDLWRRLDAAAGRHEVQWHLGQGSRRRRTERTRRQARPRGHEPLFGRATQRGRLNPLSAAPTESRRCRQYLRKHARRVRVFTYCRASAARTSPRNVATLTQFTVYVQVVLRRFRTAPYIGSGSVDQAIEKRCGPLPWRFGNDLR